MARRGFVSLTVGMMVFFASIASADVPHMISYQGKLTTAAGGCLNDTVQMTFSIYPDTLGSPADWSETQTEVVVKEGIFNVLLGAVDTIPSALFGGNIKYLGVQVEADPEMRPLKPMVSVAYAYRAGTADGGGGGGGWVDDGDVVRLETAADSVGIGTGTPVAKLDVVGDVNVNSVYKIDGDTVLSTKGSGNTFVGAGAGSANTTGNVNTFVGLNAGYRNTEGYRNTFVGRTAGFANTTGNANTFLGWKAGTSHTRNDDNTFVGAGAGFSDTAGYNNTFLGSSAGYSNDTGHYNMFTGTQAGYSNTVGSYNTFTGAHAGHSNTTGFSNTFLGWAAGYSNTTAHHNTFLGMFAGYMNTTGENNTFLGYNAGSYNTTGDSNVFIGYEAGFYETGSNKLFIANSNTTTPLIYGDFSAGRVGIGTKTPGTKFAVDGLTGTTSYYYVRVNTVTGDFYYQTSSNRYKEDIQPFEDDYHKIFQADPKSFIDKASGQREIGYIAEEFDEIGLNSLVIYDKEGQPNGLKYELVSLYLLEVMKDQAEALKEIKAENEELKGKIEALGKR
jgi:hypothetical protein